MAETGSGVRPTLIRAALLIFLALGLFGCDHATKFAAKASLEGAAAVPIAPDVLRGAVELRYAQNDDVAFSALHQLGVPRSPGVLAAVAAIAMTVLLVTAVVSLRRAVRRGEAVSVVELRASQVGLALILGGALGNLVDRIARGYVVDFIHVKGWPIFNVADIAVVAGMMLLGIARLAFRSKEAPHPG